MPGWPLPSTQLDMSAEHPQWRKFPDAELLMDTALGEKRHDDAIAWHGRITRDAMRFDNRDSILAEAVQQSHPDVAVKLWKKMAEKLIAETAYEQAVACLRKAETVCTREHREAEWSTYVAKLREDNRRRRKFLQVLDRLQHPRRPILVGQG